jgi:hypothetical protein
MAPIPAPFGSSSHASAPESGTNVELKSLHHQLDQALKRLAKSRGNKLANLKRGPVHRFLRARLAWGRYQEDMMIPAEGRTRFPNISFDIIFDPATGTMTDGLSLTLETAS